MRIIFKVVLVSMSTIKTAEFSRVASTSEIPPGIMRKVTVDGQDVVLANVDGKYFAIGDVCTHQEGPLDEGILDNYEVECPWHGSRFDLRTGAVKEGPAGNPEPTYEVRIDGVNIQRRSLFPNPERLRIGCSGWSYQDWVGPFYPRDAKPGDYLKLYSNVFNAVEIDSTYYRTPSPLMVANWRKITPEAFVFTAKFPKKITHELKLRDSLAQLERYYKSISELREKLGALLIQLPPSFNYKKDKEALEIFVGQIDTKYKHAIEFRNKSWFKPDIYKLLESKNVALAWSENQYASTPPEATADIAYLRMVTDRTITNFGGTQKDQSQVLKKWYDTLEEKSNLFRKGFIFFNNHFAGFGPGSVNEFRRLAGLAELDWKGMSTEAGPLQSSISQFQQ